MSLNFGGYLPPQTVDKLRFDIEWTSAIRIEQFNPDSVIESSWAVLFDGFDQKSSWFQAVINSAIF